MNNIMNNIEGLALLEKPKQKLTLITIGGGMMGCDSRTMIVTQGKLLSGGRMVLAYAAPRARKKYNLEGPLRKGAILLKGHVDKQTLPIFEGDVRTEFGYTMILDGKGGRFADAAGDGGRTLLNSLKENLLLHTLKQDMQLALYAPRIDSHKEREVLDPQFQHALLRELGPASHLYDDLGHEFQRAHPPRKILLTDAMKTKLKAREGKPAKPIFKIFDPGGAGTWLLCSMEPDDDTLWAVCDIGFGVVEYGTVSLTELETTRSKAFNLHMERDKYFTGAGMSVATLTSLESLQQCKGAAL